MHLGASKLQEDPVGGERVPWKAVVAGRLAPQTTVEKEPCGSLVLGGSTRLELVTVAAVCPPNSVGIFDSHLSASPCISEYSEV